MEIAYFEDCAKYPTLKFFNLLQSLTWKQLPVNAQQYFPHLPLWYLSWSRTLISTMIINEPVFLMLISSNYFLSLSQSVLKHIILFCFFPGLNFIEQMMQNKKQNQYINLYLWVKWCIWIYVYKGTWYACIYRYWGTKELTGKLWSTSCCQIWWTWPMVSGGLQVSHPCAKRNISGLVHPCLFITSPIMPYERMCCIRPPQ